MAGLRDDFSAATIRTLQERASNHCSNPLCNAPTSGPHTDPQKAIRVGRAAHICAAAPGGKRYDPTMTPEERSDISNGIWLCATCAALVDTDEYRFHVSLLRDWKVHADQARLVDLNAIEESVADTYLCGHCCHPVPMEASICPNCEAEVVWGSSRAQRVADFQMFGATYLLMCFVFGIWIPEWVNSAFHTRVGNIFSILSLPVFVGLAGVFCIGAFMFIEWRSSTRRNKGPQFIRYRYS